MSELYLPEIYISKEQIQERLQILADEVHRDYVNREILIVCILKGAFMFCSDVMKKLQLPVQLEFMSLSSYGEHTKSSGRIRVDLDLNLPIDGKHVLIVEDIIDTGLTIHFVKKLLLSRHPASLKLMSLLYKPGHLKYEVHIDYLGFEIEDKFVIGYGLDYAGRYRELPYIGVLNAAH